MERSLMVAGFGGQGVMMLGTLLSLAVCNHTDNNVTYFPSYGAAMRGGTANCYVVISDEQIGEPKSTEQDDLIAMNDISFRSFIGSVKPGGTVLANSSLVTTESARKDVIVVKAPVTDIANEMGNPKAINLIMLGVYIGYTNAVEPEIIEETIKAKLGRKRPELLPLNIDAFRRGLKIGRGVKQ